MTQKAVLYMPGGDRPAGRLAERLGIPCAPIEVHRFPDGESLVTLPLFPDLAVLYCSLDRPNDKLVELLLAAQTLRAKGCRNIVLVAPYMCYMRQDKAFAAGQAISQQIIGEFLSSLADAVVTVDPHLHRVSSLTEVFTGTQVVTLSAADLIADYLSRLDDPSSILLMGPDEEATQWVEAIAVQINAETLVARKERRGDRSVTVQIPKTVPVSGRRVVLIDDVVSTGKTLEAIAQGALSAGAASVEAVIVHALFGSEVSDSLATAGIAKIASTDSIVHPTNQIHLAPLLAAALKSKVFV